MPSKLSTNELKMAQSILRSTQLTKPMAAVAWLFLIIGALIILTTIYSYFGEIHEMLSGYTGLPGFTTGVLFFILFLALRKRVIEINTMASILKKFSVDQEPEVH